MRSSRDEYVVGYRKPPAEKQFKKGASGNPKGRPKGSKNMATQLNNILRQLVQVTENGKSRRMPRMEAMLLQLTNRALTGDPRAMREVVMMQRLSEAAEEGAAIVPVAHERDTEMMQGILLRMQGSEFLQAEQPEPLGTTEQEPSTSSTEPKDPQ